MKVLPFSYKLIRFHASKGISTESICSKKDHKLLIPVILEAVSLALKYQML